MKEQVQIRETGRIMSQRLQYNTYFQNIRRERKGIQPKEAAVNLSCQSKPAAANL